MARLARPRFPDAIYHVTSRGNRGAPIHQEPAEFRRLITVLSQTAKRCRWRCLAYCLMTNHYHLVVVTPEPNISQGMHHLNGTYARWFNRRNGHQGHLFQERFHSSVIESDWHLLEACRYVVLNPVRAGIVNRPDDWEWSSYRATIGMASQAATPGIDELLCFFGQRRDAARQAFRTFVADAPNRRPF